MRPLYGLCITAGTVAFIASDTLASPITIDALPDKGPVLLSGTVDTIENEREFTLRDETGTVEVDLISGESVVLKEGARVNVAGSVDKGWFGKDIDATEVHVHKNAAEALTDAIETTTGVSIEGAKSVNISNLPEVGMVKLSGIVESVENEKKFTLKDATGRINIDIATDEAAVFSEGTEVTVIGYVQNGLLGKQVNATRIIVTNGAQPIARHE